MVEKHIQSLKNMLQHGELQKGGWRIINRIQTPETWFEEEFTLESEWCRKGVKSYLYFFEKNNKFSFIISPEQLPEPPAEAEDIYCFELTDNHKENRVNIRNTAAVLHEMRLKQSFPVDYKLLNEKEFKHLVFNKEKLDNLKKALKKENGLFPPLTNKVLDLCKTCDMTTEEVSRTIHIVLTDINENPNNNPSFNLLSYIFHPNISSNDLFLIYSSGYGLNELAHRSGPFKLLHTIAVKHLYVESILTLLKDYYWQDHYTDDEFSQFLTICMQNEYRDKFIDVVVSSDLYSQPKKRLAEFYSGNSYPL